MVTSPAAVKEWGTPDSMPVVLTLKMSEPLSVMLKMSPVRSPYCPMLRLKRSPEAVAQVDVPHVGFEADREEEQHGGD